MKFGMNLLLWTTHVTQAHEKTLNDIKEIGYDLVEVPVFDRDPDHHAKLGKVIQEIGLETSAVCACTPEGNPISADASVRAVAVEESKRAIDCCAALGADLICGPMHSTFGVFSGVAPTADEWKRSIEHMQIAAEYARTLNVRISSEFLNRFECYLLNTTADTSRWVDDVGAENVGILYDTHHANIEEKNAAAAITDHIHNINHVHISENDRSTPGMGQVRWKETFDALANVNYDGLLVVEAFGTSIPELIPVVKVWRKMFETEEKLAADALAFMKNEWSARVGD